MWERFSLKWVSLHTGLWVFLMCSQRLSLKDFQSVKLLQHSFSHSLPVCLCICDIWISPGKHLERVFELKSIFITWIKQEFCLIFPWEKCIYIFKCDHLLKCHSLCETSLKRSCLRARALALATSEQIHKWSLRVYFYYSMNLLIPRKCYSYWKHVFDDYLQGSHKNKWKSVFRKV